LSSSRAEQALRDILEGIAHIEAFTAGIKFEEFRADAKTIAAVERKLLLIGEAAVRLGREAPMIVPEVPWRHIRNMGNLLRHEYDRVDLTIIWQTITDDLPVLQAAIVNALKNFPPSHP
jgi:uncharacterized protein with HEPN domain